MRTAVPEALLTVDDYEQRALELLPAHTSRTLQRVGVRGFETLTANVRAFDRLEFRPRVLRAVEQPTLATMALNDPIGLPVMVAPSGGHGRFHPDGEVATAAGASAAGTLIALSTLSSKDLEEVRQTGAPAWYQLYLFEDRALNSLLVANAEAAGYTALVVTVDMPVTRYAPDSVARMMRAAANDDRSLRLGTFERLGYDFGDGEGVPTMLTLPRYWRPALSWADLEWLRTITSLPIVVKGIQTGEDARLCVEHGFDALVVSNHGGYAAQGARASIDALPEVVEAVDGRLEVYLDGGIRRGSDVLKCLALGARAVFVGRPALWGLAVGGDAGVHRVLEILKEELDLAMRNCGVADVAKVDAGLL